MIQHLRGRHDGCSYLAEPGTNCNKCGWFNGDDPTFEQGPDLYFDPKLVEQFKNQTESAMSEEYAASPRAELIKKMVERFLSWKLPGSFAPDGGISFSREWCMHSKCWPVGTNLFTSDEARAMFEFAMGPGSAFISKDRLEVKRLKDLLHEERAKFAEHLDQIQQSYNKNLELVRQEGSNAPVPMIMACPSCGERHVDEGEFATRPHHTHACQACGFVWRPAKVATVGVHFLPGMKN
jgi:hypothetical protein